MIAGVYNIICQQGAVLNLLVQIQQPDLATDPTGGTHEPFDLRGHTARMQVRRTLESSTFLAQLTTENGGLIINPDSVEPFPGTDFNNLQILMTSGQTAALTSGGVYDIEIINEDGYVSRLLKGEFKFDHEVTR
jgi:hypothetical protein